jgi:FemAB-related protein (PEP-CTERM system-associated)
MSTPADTDWNGFVNGHPEGSFFHLAAWRDVAKALFGHPTYHLTARRGGAICGVLPLLEVRSRLFGHSLIANGFCVGGGPIATDREALDDLLGQAERLGRKLGVQYVELRDTPIAGAGWRAKSNLYAGFERRIATSEEDNLRQIPRKQRAVVRKAIERGMDVRVERTTENYFPLYARTMRDHGTPALPKLYFEALLKVFGEDCEILTVSKAGRPIASVLSYFYRARVLPYYTGSHPEARGAGANDLMYWALMRRAVERGCDTFDFGRSKVDTGPYGFKRNWGFEPRPIIHQFRLLGVDTLPEVNPNNPRYAATIQLWRRLPLPVANALSPLLSRSLG